MPSVWQRMGKNHICHITNCFVLIILANALESFQIWATGVLLSFLFNLLKNAADQKSKLMCPLFIHSFSMFYLATLLQKCKTSTGKEQRKNKNTNILQSQRYKCYRMMETVTVCEPSLTQYKTTSCWELK